MLQDAERTLCDALRGTSSPDLQVLSPAFRSCLSSGGRNLHKLQSFAGKLGVAAKARRYMGVPLTIFPCSRTYNGLSSPK